MNIELLATSLMWPSVLYVINAINTVFSKELVCFPVGSQLNEVIDGFKEKWGIIQCAGAIDGSHIPVSAPAGNHTDY